MKINYLLLPLFLTSSLFSKSTKSMDQQKKICPFPLIAPLVEIKLGYFSFLDSNMQSLYHEGGIDVMLAGSYPVFKYLALYGAVEFFGRDGLSSGSKEKAEVYGIPLSLGFKPFLKMKESTFIYAIIGPRYSFIQVRPNSSFLPKEINSGGIGFFTSLGLNIIPAKHFLIDLFGEYSFIPVRFKTSGNNIYGNDVNGGGLTFGGGLGYEF